MNRCRHCGTEFEAFAEGLPGASEPKAALCPHCGSADPLGESDSAEVNSSKVPIARFTNMAELGFFEEMLADNHIEMAVREVDEFNAAQGQWNRHYILSVDKEDSTRAAELMQGQLGTDEPETSEAAQSEERTTPQFDPALDRDEAELGLDPAKLWVPVVLVMLAGGLTFWALTSKPANETPPENKLWEALGELNEPLESLPRPGGFSRRLRFDPDTGHIILEDDTNGDQHIDRYREYSRERLLIDREQ